MVNVAPLAAMVLSSALILTAAPASDPHAQAAALVRQMTMEEKIAQMQDRAPAIPRLHIPAYGWWNEALHGVARNGLATVFPQAIGRAAAWDTALERRIGDAISTEARAKFNIKGDRADHARYQGLTFWSPNINIFRDPRWGRGQETFGEDPYLTAQVARAFIAGLQGDHPKRFRTIATSKHFAVHSGPETGRHGFDAQVTNADLDGTYLRAFHETLTSNGAYSVMCAYNRVDGVPACASTDLLGARLRNAWGFRGYVVSDCGAVDDIYSGHHYTPSLAEAAARAVRAGTDLTCGTEYRHLPEALANGSITEAEIDRAVTRLFEARIRLGLFDEHDPFSQISVTEIASGVHASLALQAAEKSMVLLKNNGRLPLASSARTIAVIGPAANDPDTLLGNYYGTPLRLVTPLSGFKAQFQPSASVHFSQGSLYVEGVTALVPAANLPGGLRAQYNLEASASVITRTEPQLFFIREMDSSLRGKPVDAVWEGILQPSFSGVYALGIAHQECDSCPGEVAAKLFLEGKPLLTETRKAADGAGARTIPVRLEAGHSYALRIEYSQHAGGSGIELVWSPPAKPMLEEAGKLAEDSDVTVLCLGLNSRLEGEELKMKIPGFSGGDRTSLDLPASQRALLQRVLETGKPVIAVLLNGSALSLDAPALAKLDALLEAWYPGQEGGTAIARTLAGLNNPAGRLPVTFYRSVDQLPAFTSYSMQNRTYRYFSGDPLFPFGFGLSYSTFRYQTVPGNRPSAKITNTSKRDGDEVAQLYIPIADGRWQLAGFERIHLRAGETRGVTFASTAAKGWQITGALPAPRP